MKLTAEDIITITKREMHCLHHEILELSNLIAGARYPMSNEDYHEIQGYYERQHIAHNQYLTLVRLINLIEAAEEEKQHEMQ